MINSSQTNSPVTLWFYTDFNAGTYNVIHNDPDQNHRAAAWLLVKKTCGSSDKWTNEASRFEKMMTKANCHIIIKTRKGFS